MLDKSYKNQLLKAVKKQNEYDLKTINLIAPASPTPLKYFYEHQLHNAIAEGLLGKRPYAGAQAFNDIESITAKVACDLFNAEHANVQPHSVSQANQAVYQALLNNGDRVLAMEFHAGGHLTHGLNINFSGRFFKFDFYGVDKKGIIDYVQVEKLTIKQKPKMIVCGASSYPRIIDFGRLKKIADKVGAYLVADLSHPAGLIIAGRFPQPFPSCDVATFTPDKTMLGPHGGIILCSNKLSRMIDKAVHPGVQSSIPLHRIFHTALSLIDCGTKQFSDYIDRVINNMKVFEEEFRKIKGFMVTGGSDTHLMVLDTHNTFGLTGKDAEILLEKINILTNRQVVPDEKFEPYVASGIRLGTSWVTARGFKQKEIQTIARTILSAFGNPESKIVLDKSRKEMNKLIGIERKDDVWKGEDKKYGIGKYNG